MEKQKFKLTIDITTEFEKFGCLQSEGVEGDSLVEVLSKLPLIVLKIQERINEDERIVKDDDIPF